MNRSLENLDHKTKLSLLEDDGLSAKNSDQANVSRRGALKLTGVASAGISGVFDNRAWAAESFCGLNGGAIPSWAYRTDFDVSRIKPR